MSFNVDDIGGMISSPWMQWLMSMISSGEQGRVQDEYTAATDQDIADWRRIASLIGPEGMATFDASNQPAGNEWFGLRGRQGQGHYDRYVAAEQDLKGYGEQMSADIDSASRQAASGQEAFLRERGLFNASTAPDFNLRVEKDRTAEQRRLGEDLTRMRLGILSGLSGEALQADERGTGNIANWLTNTGINRSNISDRGFNAFIDSISGVNRVPPPQNMLPGQYGANAVPGPQAPGFWQSAGPGIVQGGIGAAGTIAAATIIVAVCIGEDSELTTLEGPKSLKDIKVGDEVLTDTGFFKRIVAKHLGNYKGEWDKVFVNLMHEGRSIVASRDHVIDGRRADEWIVDGEATWKPCGPMRVGDILVEGEHDYMANGFAVRSLIGPDDLATLAAMEPENQVPAGA
jgi:hypothetical protein